MQGIACTRMAAAHLVPGAGHWVQQEQPARTVELLKDLLAMPFV
jgi:pimeloyl-ACP methyl ester carboxylesterase